MIIIMIMIIMIIMIISGRLPHGVRDLVVRRPLLAAVLRPKSD